MRLRPSSAASPCDKRTALRPSFSQTRDRAVPGSSAPCAASLPLDRESCTPCPAPGWRGTHAPPPGKSLLFARAPSLRLCRGSGLVDQEIVALFAFLDCRCHPPWHRTTSGPSLSARPTVLGGDRCAFQRATAAGSTATGADVLAERGKRPL